MTNELVKRIQTALKKKGYDPGPIDGILGRMTAAAVAQFQKDTGLAVKWPGTIGEITIKALLGGSNAAIDEAVNSNIIARPWYTLALSKKGLHEDGAAIPAFLKSDGKTVGDPSENPWCGDFVETCIALTLRDEPMIANPYLARNWLKWGVPCEPQFGAVMVYWRGKKDGISGHVAFCAGESDKAFYNLGGNQSDRVTVAPLDKGRLLGARWPKTVPIPSRLIMPTLVGGQLSTNEA